MIAQPLKIHLHALAERLGYTVRDLAGRVTLSELRDWLAYDRYRRGEEPAVAGPISPAQAAMALGVKTKKRKHR